MIYSLAARNMIQWVTMLLLLSVTLSCYSTVLVDIDHYRSPVSVWDGSWMSYGLTFSSGEDIDWIWGIKGFSQYEWGYRYKVKLMRKRILDPPMDTPSIEYSLVEVLSKEKVPDETLFPIKLKDNRDTFVSLEERGLMLLKEVEIRINQKVDSLSLMQLLPICQSVEGVFSHHRDGGLELHDFTYEFNNTYAIDYLFMQYPGSEFENIENWDESNFMEYINKYAK